MIIISSQSITWDGKNPGLLKNIWQASNEVMLAIQLGKLTRLENVNEPT